MRRTLPTALLVGFAFAGCGSPSGTPADDITFADPGLQECYERLLSGPDGKPTAEEIVFMRCFDVGIRNLDGLEVLTGLEQLILSGNPLENIEPVVLMDNLNWLDLGGCGLEQDSVEILSRLETPVRLFVGLNNLGDVSLLGRATSLTDLYANSTGITAGVAELSTLVNAGEVSVGGNPESPCSDLATLRAALPNARVTPTESDVRPGIDCAP